jgi:hypothetical protein
MARGREEIVAKRERQQRAGNQGNTLLSSECPLLTYSTGEDRQRVTKATARKLHRRSARIRELAK